MVQELKKKETTDRTVPAHPRASTAAKPRGNNKPHPNWYWHRSRTVDELLLFRTVNAKEE